MISPHLLLAYIGAVLLISGTPGPNMLLAMTQGLRHGWRASLPTMLGAVTGVLLIMLASISGLGAILQTSNTLFLLLKWLGAAYLVCLGVGMWRSSTTPLPLTVSAPSTAAANDSRFASHSASQPPAHAAVPPSVRSRVLTGLGVALSNPKAFLFGLAFFPQFISANQALLPQATLLLGIFVFIELSWMSIYASCGAWLSNKMQSPTSMRRYNRISGAAFVLAGLGLGVFGKSH